MTDKKDKLSKLATEQQMSAADPQSSVWVEASAGTGKTKVLSDRVLRLLLEKVNPSKILCLTYTKAAAVEMNTRIAKRLSAWAIESDEDLAKDLSCLLGKKFETGNTREIMSFARTLFALLLDAPGGMKIQTIHSFCGDILKRFPLEAGISPYFEVIQDRKSNEIIQDIQKDILKASTLNPDSDIAHAVSFLTKNVSESSFPEVMKQITANRTKITELLRMNNNDLACIIDKLQKKLGVKLEDTEDVLKRRTMNGIDRNLMAKVADALVYGQKTDKGNSDLLKEMIAHDFALEYFDTYKNIFLTKDKVRAESKIVSNGSVAAFPQIRDIMLCEGNRLVGCIDLFKSLTVLKSTHSVLTIAKRIIDSYSAYKEKFSALDFEDLIIITRNLLENPTVADWVLFKLDGGIEHILIDEAQDTSPNQWAIIKDLTREFFAGDGAYESALPRTVFVVGDRKQSIFSFQGADPREFDKMYNHFKQSSSNFKKVHLDVSFRSTSAVMDCVNTLFENEVAKQGVVPKDEHINHIPYRLGESGKVEIWPPKLKEDEPSKEKKEKDIKWIVHTKREESVSSATEIVKDIAKHIKEMVTSKKHFVKNRPLRYGDFMFLVQRRSDIVEEFIRACKEINVSVSGVDRLKLLEQITVQDLISLGKFLLLPKDDLSLAEVLKSPLFNLDDEDLFQLCYNRKDSLFNSLLKNSEYATIADKLKFLLSKVDFLRPFELFHLVLVQMDGRKKFVERIGYEADDVLDEFLNLSLMYEQEHTPTLEAFINWIVQDEVVIKKEMEQGDNDQVKIMTVHGSKGLQAPIVILADTIHKKSALRKMNFLWDDDSSLLFPVGSSSYDMNCQEIFNKNCDDENDEYRRLLYVALTRAEDCLYIAGFSNTKSYSNDSWYGLLENNIKSNVELPRGDHRIVYEVLGDGCSSDDKKSEEIHFKECDFSKVLTPAPIEDARAKPYKPSKDESDETEIVASPLEDDGKFYRRGSVIHKLLQYIVTLDEENREDAAYLFLKKNLPDYSDDNIYQIIDEVMYLCHNHQEIFKGHSLAEVPIIGEVDGKIISAKVDRLIVNDDSVIVVDYKTNRPAATCPVEVPALYLKQLQAYKILLQRIYPDKNVKTYLLWTNTCNLMEV